MKIAIVSTLYRGGGAERSARELFERLLSRGHQCTMLVAHRKGDEPPQVQQTRRSGERALRIFGRAGFVADWTHRGSIRALASINSSNTDIVHLHNLHGNWISVEAVAQLCHRVPTVWTLHDEWAVTGGIPYDLTRFPLPYQVPMLPQYRPGTRDAARWQRFLSRHLPQPNVVISPSLYIQKLAIESRRFGDTPIEHIPYGLTLLDRPEIALPQSAARERFKLPPDKPVILLIAAHLQSPYKGIPLAIAALKKIPFSAAHVLIAGSGGQTIADAIPQPSTVAGFISDESTLACAFRSADLTIMPSIADNFPYAALESMACRTPIAAFDIGGMTEMIGSERGVLAKPFNIDQLAINIALMLDKSQLRQPMGDGAHAWVAQNCNMTRWVERHEGLYDRAQQTAGAQTR